MAWRKVAAGRQLSADPLGSVLEVVLYILGINALRRDLSRDVLDPGDVALYVFLAGISVPIFYFEEVSDPVLAGAATSLAFVFSQLAISALGVWRCYLANGGRTGHRFAERFIAISWVVGMRLLLLVAPAFLLLLVLDVESATPWVESAWVVFSVVYFWRVWVHIAWVAEHARNAA